MYDPIAGEKGLVGGVSLNSDNNSTTSPEASLLHPVSVFGSDGSSFTTHSLTGVLCVENAQSNTISVVDLATNAIVRDITFGEAPYYFKLSED